MTREFSIRTRSKNLEAMAAGRVDVLVIGGGIVGAWTALIAALRGYRTALVEKGDFASGTSGKTSHLVHGGLRYLQQRRIGLVRQAARERDILLKIAPRLVKPQTFMIPIYKGRGPKGWQLRIGLWLYDALSKDKVLPKRRWLSRKETIRLEPTMRREGLIRAALYADAFVHDARLVLRVVQAAGEAGALIANYARATEVLRGHHGTVTGAAVEDLETGVVREIRASFTVNATGVWSDTLRARKARTRLRPTKGVHLLVPRNLIGHGSAVVIPVRDGRTVFVLPWGNLSLIGTTDTDFRGDKDRVRTDRADVEYLLKPVNEIFPHAGLTPSDVVSTYAGLRPLVDTGEVRESDISRKHEIVFDPDGLITLIGGKLTTSRAMALQLLRWIDRRYERRQPIGTGGIALAMPPPGDPISDLRRIGVDSEVASRLVEAGAAKFARSEGWRRSALARRLGKDVPVCGLEILYSARHEMAVHLEDVLLRRTGLFYLQRNHGADVASAVADILAEELGWDADRRMIELERFEELIDTADLWQVEVLDG